MNTILLFVGPSCSGKTTLMRELLQRHPEMFERLKSFTSRARRDGEDDMEYDFVSVEDVVHMQKSGDVTQQVFLNGNWYGTRTSDIDRIIASGKVPVCIVEPGGVTQFTKVGEDKGFKPLTFYINGSSETILRRWLERVPQSPRRRSSTSGGFSPLLKRRYRIGAGRRRILTRSSTTATARKTLT